MPSRTNSVNRVSGVYESVCHPNERIILEGQIIPRCGTCNQETEWTLLRKISDLHDDAATARNEKVADERKVRRAGSA